jgi:heat shock 70kDa protein 1/2/6/8
MSHLHHLTHRLLPPLQAKNGLENYAFNVRNSINDEKVKGKLSDADRKTIETAVDGALRWLEEHAGSEKEEFEEKQKELEQVVMPLMQKLYAGGGAPGGMPGGFPGGMPGGDDDSAAGPKIEEVD